jgi:outer membrane protein assembly factor BamB
MVVDGNTNTRVAGARLRVAGRVARTDRLGIAHLALRRLGALVTRIDASGYSAKELRLPFGRARREIVRIYRPALQWPMYGVDAQRTQAQTQIRLRPPFRVVWSRPTGGLTEFPAVVSDGIAYIGNYSGTVQALDMRDGQQLWSRATPGGKMASSPAVWNDRIVVHGMDGYIRILRRADGKVLHMFYVGAPVESSPLVYDDVDYFGAWNGVVYALDLRTHRVRWRYSSGAKITSSAAVVGGTVYIGNYAGRLIALRERSGRTRFTAAVNGRIYGTPAVAYGRVFVPSSDGNSLTAFSRTGARKWVIHTGAYVYSSPAVWGGRVFFGSYNGVLYCVAPRSGRVLWAKSTGGAISGAPTVVDGIVYFGNFRHRIYGLSAHSGRRRFAFPDGDYVPVSGNGGRLLLHGYSRLYAVEPRRR